MTNLSKTMTEMQEMAKSAGTLVATLPAAGSQGAHFWQAQEMILSELEQFSSSWFKRRHEGTRAAIEASKRFAAEATGNPTVAMEIMTDWQSHSMERMAEDAKNCAEVMKRCAEAFVSNEVEAIEETVETAKRATKTAKSSPV